jgi:hypothetical protein
VAHRRAAAAAFLAVRFTARATATHLPSGEDEALTAATLLLSS